MSELSIIIPTYNRAGWLGELLDSIAAQEIDSGHFEVIVVDDGSSDATAEVAGMTYPFPLRYVRQENQGDAGARNTGAQQSEAESLLFLDDDIILDSRYVARILAVWKDNRRALVMGNDVLWLQDENPLEAGVQAPELPAEAVAEIPFADMCSNNMIVGRAAYFELGMMEGLGFSGSSMWCDVDFAYRARRQGYAFLRSLGAVCWHRDRTQRSLESHARRMEEVAYRAVTLFEKFPGIEVHLPMFDDMLPIDFRTDRPVRVLRKSLRGISAAGPVLGMMERAHALTRRQPVRRALRKWIVGANIYRGYRRGLAQKG